MTDPGLANVLCRLDRMLFAVAIGIKTYFQKITDPAAIASTAGVSFTINHVAAVVIPVVVGFVWLESPALVFLCGQAMACISLVLACLVPPRPGPGSEVALRHPGAVAARPAATETPGL